MQIPFKAITAFHTLHLQQCDVPLALNITSATIMKIHQHVCKAAAHKNPDLTTTDGGEYRNRSAIKSCNKDMTSVLILHTAMKKFHGL